MEDDNWELGTWLRFGLFKQQLIKTILFLNLYFFTGG